MMYISWEIKQLSNSSLVLLGDINFPDIDWNVISLFQLNLLSNILCDCIVNHFGLKQVIDSPMRSESILDLHAIYLADSPKVLQILISTTVLVLQITDLLTVH